MDSRPSVGGSYRPPSVPLRHQWRTRGRRASRNNWRLAEIINPMFSRSAWALRPGPWLFWAVDFSRLGRGLAAVLHAVHATGPAAPRTDACTMAPPRPAKVHGRYCWWLDRRLAGIPCVAPGARP